MKDSYLFERGDTINLIHQLHESLRSNKYVLEKIKVQYIISDSTDITANCSTNMISEVLIYQTKLTVADLKGSTIKILSKLY